MLAQGEAPLWNPYRGAGQPLMANPNALVLHPTTLLFFVLPFEAAFKASVILQILLAGVGFWFLLRDLAASRAAGFLGASVFCFSGYMISLGNLINLLNSAAFMPLTVWLGLRAVRRGFAPWGSLAALSLAVQFLAGEPAILICTLAALVGAVGIASASDGPASATLRLKKAAVLAGAVTLGFALSMVGTLPALELAARSERGAGFDKAEALKWSQPPLAMLQMVIPEVFGDPTSTDTSKYWGYGIFDAGLPLVLSIYLGPGATMLALVGAWAGLRSSRSRRAETLVLGLLATAGVVLAVGRFLPLYPALLAILRPLESVRYPVKYFLLVTWAVSFLAARGYDAIAGRRSEARNGPRRVLAAVLLGGGAGLVFVTAGAAIVGWSRSVGLGDAQQEMGLVAPLPLLKAGFALALVWMASSFRWSRASLLTLVMVPVLDLVLGGMSLNPVTSASFYSEPPETARLLDEGPGRLWAMPRPRGFAYRAPSAVDADSLEWGFRWDRMTLRNATYFPQKVRFAYDRGNERLDVMPGAAVGRLLYEQTGGSLAPEETERLLSVAAVGQFITYGGLGVSRFPETGRLEGRSNIPVVVMQNAAVLPRAYTVTGAEVVPDTASALRRLRETTFDPSRVVILDQGPDMPADAPERGERYAPATIIEETPTHVRVRCSSSASGYLVLADTYYPGWSATVNGVETPLRRANAMFRAVPIPVGGSMVEFVYRPSSVSRGLKVSAAGLLLAGLLAVPRRR